MRIGTLRPVAVRGVVSNKYFMDCNGNPFRKTQNGEYKLVGVHRRKSGYWFTNLRATKGFYKQVSVARLTANAWLGLNLKKKNSCKDHTHHVNENPSDNYYKNIKVMTSKKHLTVHLGKPVEVVGPRGGKKQFDSITLAAEFLGRSVSAVQNVLRGTTPRVAGCNVRRLN